MVVNTTTPTQMQGYMISSSDINDDDKEDSTPLNTPAANPRGIYDTAYEGGRLRSGSTTTMPSPPSSPDMEELERKAIELRDQAVKTNTEAQAKIARELAKPWHSDFPESCISPTNDGLRTLWDERNHAEGDLMDMPHDRAADGTTLSPNRDYEEQFQLANDRYNQLNRAMYTSFANSMQMAANMAEARVSDLTRTKPTRKQSASDQIEPNQSSTAGINACPYDHIRDHRQTTPTIPRLENLDDTLPASCIPARAPNRPPTPRFILESPPITDQEPLLPHPDISYDLTDPRPQQRARTGSPTVEDQSASSDNKFFMAVWITAKLPQKGLFIDRWQKALHNQHG
jgi:hypothetical protein